MQTTLPYGREKLTIEIPVRDADIIRPRYPENLRDEAAAFRVALENPLGCLPASQLFRPDHKVAIVIPDITRALPSDRLLTWLFAALPALSPDNITIIVGTGTHRPNTADEIASMVGPEIARSYRIINHDAFDNESLLPVGKNTEGMPILMARDFVEADRRIIMGFIEPHFMAGFSGGYKAIFPGIADLNSIMYYHRAAVIGDPRSTWGNLDKNPTQEQVRYNGSQTAVDLCINVTLNDRGQITQFFCGDVTTAHDAGCAFAKDTAMAPCHRDYPLVITSNSGYPLDQNLYQAVKGMSAAAQIVRDGGLILIVARCNDGFPDHGNFRKLLFDYETPQAFLNALNTPGFQLQDQWQNQLLALIQLKARVAVYSELDPALVARAHMEPVTDLNAFIAEETAKLSADDAVAVLPEGPMTIPYLA